MPGLLDLIPGYRDAVARETVGRDAAYLRLPRLVAGIALRPLTLRDYLRLSAENSPFVAGGRPGREDVAFLLWHSRLDPKPDDDPLEFAERFDGVDLDFLKASCAAFIAEAMADSSPGGSGRASFCGLGAALIHTFRHEYGCSRDEILDSPIEELLQESRAIQLRLNPRAVLFNRSDTIKGEYLRRRSEEMAAARVKPPRKRRRIAIGYK